MVEQSYLDIGSSAAAFGISQPLTLHVANATSNGGQEIDVGAVGVGRREEGTSDSAIEIGSRHRAFDTDHPGASLIIKSRLTFADDSARLDVEIRPHQRRADRIEPVWLS